MRNKYLAVSTTENEKHVAFDVKVSENENLVSAMAGIKNLTTAQICETKDKAQDLSDFWNECYRKNGTHMYTQKEMDKFTAKPCNFQGKNGYMVSQIHNGEEVCKQFVAESCYETFCEAIGIVPEMEDALQDILQENEMELSM